MNVLLEKKPATWADFRSLEIPDGDMQLYELINRTIVKRTAPSLRHQNAGMNLETATIFE